MITLIMKFISYHSREKDDDRKNLKSENKRFQDEDELDALFRVFEKYLNLISQKPEETKARFGFEDDHADDKLNHNARNHSSPLDVGRTE